MVSSHSLTELQLLRSGMALSISGGLFKLKVCGGGVGSGEIKISWRESEDEKRLRREEEAPQPGGGFVVRW